MGEGPGAAMWKCGNVKMWSLIVIGSSAMNLKEGMSRPCRLFCFILDSLLNFCRSNLFLVETPYSYHHR
jgi:hypothetical protein